MLKILKIAIFALPILLLAAGCASVAEQPRPQLTEANEAEEQAHRVHSITGSRIPHRRLPDGRSFPHHSAPVITYDQEAIRSTGQRDLEAALFILDTTVR